MNTERTRINFVQYILSRLYRTRWQDLLRRTEFQDVHNYSSAVIHSFIHGKDEDACNFVQTISLTKTKNGLDELSAKKNYRVLATSCTPSFDPFMLNVVFGAHNAFGPTQSPPTRDTANIWTSGAVVTASQFKRLWRHDVPDF